MATLASRRAELVAALVAAGVRSGDDPGAIAAPCALVFGAGSDMTGIGRGQVAVEFRVTMLGGLSDAHAAGAELATLEGTVLTVARALAGWQVGPLSGDQIRTVAGGDYLSADLALTTTVDL